MTAMPPDPAEQLIRELFEALNSRDLERAVSFYAPEATLTFAADNAGPRRKISNIASARSGKVISGQAEIHAYFRWLLSEHRREVVYELDNVTPGAGGFRATWHVESQDQGLLNEGVEQFVLEEVRIVQQASQFDRPAEGLGQPYGVSEPEASQLVHRGPEEGDSYADGDAVVNAAPETTYLGPPSQTGSRA
jgi:hypothetical protein